MSLSAIASSWRDIPLAFLGYGFLYAWGYVSWSTDSLATQSVSGGEFDLSWFVSAAVVPLALVALALIGRRRDLEGKRWLYALACALAFAGTCLSVVYQHVSTPTLAWALAVASGVGTGGASALFGLLWSLALSHLDMERLEVVVPASFVLSALAALVVPGMAQAGALATALLLVVLCSACLWRAHLWGAGEVDSANAPRGEVQGADRRQAEGSTCDDPAWGEEGDAASGRGVHDIARMLAFGVLAWAVMNAAPTVAGAGTSGTVVGGIDVAGVLGYLFSVVLALLVIRYAVRVDFQALALMTLPVLVLSMTLFALGAAPAQFWASVLNVALNSSCEIILLLYFIRLAKARPEPRAFWLALGSAASYLGVLVGQLTNGILARAGVVEADPSLFCLVVTCVYVFAMLLIPQRSYEPAAVVGVLACEATNDRGVGAPLRATRAGLGAGLGAGSAAGKTGRSGASGVLGAPGASGPLGADAGLTCSSEAAGLTRTASSQLDAPAASLDPISRSCALVAQCYQLSAREAQVCEYLARGRSQAYIRDALFLSKNSVATYVRRLYAKLDVHSKQELIDLVEGQDAR